MEVVCLLTAPPPVLVGTDEYLGRLFYAVNLRNRDNYIFR